MNQPRICTPFGVWFCVLVLGAASLSACSTGDTHAAKVPGPVAASGPGPVDETTPFTSVEPAAGLEASEARGETPAATRLVYSHVSAVVRGGSVVIQVADVVSNDGPAPVDFAYTFPLPGDATVSELAYFSGGQRVLATAQEKAQAKASFEQAKARGESATLSENTGNSRFSVAMSQLLPGESRRVELRYVQGLESFGAQRSFSFPAAHSARRGEPSLDFEVTIEGEAELSNVESLNHPDARLVKLDAKKTRVLLSRTASPLGQDLVLRWTERAEPLELSLRGVAGTGADAGYAQVDFAFNADPLPTEEPGRDFVFVVDTSLSMAGEALEQAKLLIAQSLENLSPRDRLALVQFDDQLASWGELLPASPETKERALRELRAKRAAGASNVEAAIDRARELTLSSKHPCLVFVTDGQSTVGETLDALNPAAKPADFESTRVFIALVNYPSRRPELERLFPHATLRFLPSGDAGRAIARTLATLVAAPVLENVHLDVEGMATNDRYGNLPDRLALGERIHLLGRWNGAPLKANLTATLHGHPFHFEKTAEVSRQESDRASVPREWARTKLAALELRYAAEHDPIVQTEAIELGRHFGLISSFTSLIATDRLSPDRIAPGDPELRIRAPRGESAVVALLPWGEEVNCTWHEPERSWLGRFLVPRSVSDGLYKVSVFTVNQGRTRRRGSLLLRVDSKAPHYRMQALQTETTLTLTALPEADVFDRNGDMLRLDRVDVKGVSVELEGPPQPLLPGPEGKWQISLPRLAPGRHAIAWVATDYAQNSSRSTAQLSVSSDGHEARLSTPRDSSPVVIATPDPAVKTRVVADTRCWFAKSPRKAKLLVDGKLVQLFDGFLRIDGRDVTPCTGLPVAHPIAIALHGDDFVVAFRDGTRSLYRGDTFEPAPELSRVETRALEPAAQPSVRSSTLAGDLQSGHVSALATFEGKLVVGTFDGGAFTVDANEQIAPIRDAPRFINALWAEPRKLWFASTTGLFQLENGEVHELPLPFAASHVNGLLRAQDGTLWLATSDGLLGLRGGEWRKLGEAQGLPSHIVYAIAESPDGTLWAGTAGGVARLAKAGVSRFSVENGALPHRWVTALLADASGVWVGTYQGGVSHLASNGARPVPGTQALWLNPQGLARIDGRLYAATMGGGLVAFTPNTGEDPCADESQCGNTVQLGPLPSSDVTAVNEFAGALWVGTRAGLARLPLTRPIAP